MTMDEISCPHKQQGLCLVSTRLAGIPVPLAEDACRACFLQASPREVNRVTCSKAIYSRRQAGLPVLQELLDCVRPPEQGVGSELQRLIETTRQWLARLHWDWIIPAPISCGCGSVRSALNSDSPTQCWEKRSAYIQNMVQRWIAHQPALKFVPCKKMLIASYLRIAVQRALRKESEICRSATKPTSN